jgi:uncharacterized protein (TIGR03435 family)
MDSIQLHARGPFINLNRRARSLFTAIEEQAGLKPEASREPMEVAVIEYIEKIPSEN